MLVLSRKVGERILIGDNIVITIVAIDSPHRVRVGIDAPRDVQVHREELRERRAGAEPPAQAS